jgi:hypothetical protein
MRKIIVILVLLAVVGYSSIKIQKAAYNKYLDDLDEIAGLR